MKIMDYYHFIDIIRDSHECAVVFTRTCSYLDPTAKCGKYLGETPEEFQAACEHNGFGQNEIFVAKNGQVFLKARS